MGSTVKATLNWAVLEWCEWMQEWDNGALELDGGEEGERRVEQVWKRCTGKKKNILTDFSSLECRLTITQAYICPIKLYTKNIDFHINMTQIQQLLQKRIFYSFLLN